MTTDALDWHDIVSQHVSISYLQSRHGDVEDLEAHLAPLSYYTTGDLVRMHHLIDAELQARAAREAVVSDVENYDDVDYDHDY